MNTNKTISPFNDLAFKMRFANESHPDILAGLIRDFFGFEPKSIRIVNPYDIKAYIEKRKNGEEYSTLRETLRDVTAELETADFTAEIQVKRNIHFDRRSVYYGCSTFCGNYNRPRERQAAISGGGSYDKYESLRPVYTLNILDEPYFDDAYPLRNFGLHDPKRGLALEPSYLNFGYFEPGKAASDRELTENQTFWSEHFLGQPVSEKAPGYIREAAELLDYVNMTKEERDMIDWAERVQADYQSDMWSARHEGREEAEAKAKEERLESARSMRAEGTDIDFIKRHLKLTPEEIEEL